MPKIQRVLHTSNRRRRFWHATQDCVAPYVDIILHRGWFWAKSAASGSVWWCCLRSSWTVLSHVMRGRPTCLLQSAGGEANRILLASALSSMRIICPNWVSRRDWIIAVSLGCFTSNRFTKFIEGHQYWRTYGLVGTGLMPYKAHSPKYQHFMLFAVPVYSKCEIWNSLLNYM